MKKIAVIGTGQIGSVLVQRICMAVPPESVTVYDRNDTKQQEIVRQTGCQAAESAVDAMKEANYVILAVKPQSFGALLSAILPQLHPGQCMVSTAAGLELKSIEAAMEKAGTHIPIIRIMPNLPISVGKGCILLSNNALVTQEQKNDIREILSCCGVCQDVDEEYFGMGVSLNSCTPAYVFMFLEALADGGVSLGYSRREAEEVAAQAVLGAVTLYLETRQRLGELKDAVCSPNGAAIYGVAALERGKFRSAVMNAVEASYQKNKALNFELDLTE